MKDMQDINILIVDDELIGRQLLQAVFVPEGFGVLLANDGFEAVELAKMHKPDIILCDVMMPKIDGFETTKKLKEIPEISDTPIILVTALDDRDSRIKGLECGAADYINKPFDRMEVVVKVKNHLALKKSVVNNDSSDTPKEDTAKSVNLNFFISELLAGNQILTNSNNIKVVPPEILEEQLIFMWRKNLGEKSITCLFGFSKSNESNQLNAAIISMWLGVADINLQNIAPDLSVFIKQKIESSERFTNNKEDLWLISFCESKDNSYVSGFNQEVFIHNPTEDVVKKKVLNQSEGIKLPSGTNIFFSSENLRTANNQNLSLYLENFVSKFNTSSLENLFETIAEGAQKKGAFLSKYILGG